MTEPIGNALDGEMNSDFVERITMSFSLWTMVAEHSKKQNSQPQNWLRPGADASAIHGRTERSGCTPAEPYPLSRDARLRELSHQTKRTINPTFNLAPN
jgi:hypothetical protein